VSYRPTRTQAISTLKDLVKVLKSDGAEAARLAKDLARATGLPAQTLGDGGSRGTGGDERRDSTSSAALRILEHGVDRYEDADVKLDELMAKVVVDAEVLRLYVLNLTAHAQAEETHEGDGLVRPTKAGEGECLGCGRQVPGTENDRLRGGACSACVMAWTRYQRENPHAERVVFMRKRPRHDSTDTSAATQAAADTGADAAILADTSSSARVAKVTVWHHGEVTSGPSY